jgi:hypothetical protein
MKKFLPVILLSLFVLPIIAFAATDPSIVICNVFDKVKTILASVGFGIAVIFIIVGGIKYMTSGGDAEKATSARGMIINALIGIAIILAAMFIITMVQGFLSGVGVALNPFNSPCPPAQ